jgi:hypothetical protein
MEAIMRKSFYTIAAAAIATLTLAASVKTSEAAIIYPWCAHLGGRSGGMNCGFVSYAQCMASVQGSGWCGENPWYEPPLPRDRRARRQQ